MLCLIILENLDNYFMYIYMYVRNFQHGCLVQIISMNFKTVDNEPALVMAELGMFI